MTSLWPIRYNQMSIYLVRLSRKQLFSSYKWSNSRHLAFTLCLFAFLSPEIMILCPEIQQLSNEHECKGHTHMIDDMEN